MVSGELIPCAYLRVFRPLHSYPPEEGARWERYILDGGAPWFARPVYRHRYLTEDQAVGLLAADPGEHAEVRLVGGRYYVCPWRMRQRVLGAVVSFRQSAPPDIASTFVPEAELRGAARELARLRRGEQPSVAPILQSPWHVPVRWFTLVEDDDRHLVEGPDGNYRLFYWTTMKKARRRVDRAIHALRRTELAPLGELIREMGRWLAAFDPGSRIELDYGSLCPLFTWDELDDDHSGREIQEAIEALMLPRGVPRAGELYQAVAARWAEAKSRESLN